MKLGPLASLVVPETVYEHVTQLIDKHFDPEMGPSRDSSGGCSRMAR